MLSLATAVNMLPRVGSVPHPSHAKEAFTAHTKPHPSLSLSPSPSPAAAPCADVPALGAPSAAACLTWLACTLLSSASAARSSRRRRSRSSSALAVPPA